MHIYVYKYGKITAKIRIMELRKIPRIAFRHPLRAEKFCDGVPWCTKVIVVDDFAAGGAVAAATAVVYMH